MFFLNRVEPTTTTRRTFTKALSPPQYLLNQSMNKMQIHVIIMLSKREVRMKVKQSHYVESSVTRFGEISPLWQTFTSIWQNFDSFFLIWQNAESTLAICDIFGLIFIVANGQILKNKLAIWSHWLKASFLTKRLRVVQ